MIRHLLHKTRFAAAAMLLAAGVAAQAGIVYIGQNGNPLVAQPGQTGTALNPYQLGVLDSNFSVLFATLVTRGALNEYATFSVPVASNTAIGVSNTYQLVFNAGGASVVLGSISNFMVDLRAGLPVAPGVSFGTFGAGQTFAMGLLPGSYHLGFTGTVVGTGSQYSAALTARTIPEPATASLVLLALGAAGFAARRRAAKN